MSVKEPSNVTRHIRKTNVIKRMKPPSQLAFKVTSSMKVIKLTCQSKIADVNRRYSLYKSTQGNSPKEITQKNPMKATKDTQCNQCSQCNS